MRIDLLPADHKPQPAVDAKRLGIMTAVAVLCAAAICTMLFFFFAWESSKSNLAQTQSERAMLDAEKAKLDQIDSMLAKIEQVKKELATINSGYNDYLPVFKGVATAMPSQIWLTEMNIKGKSEVTFKGSSLDYAVIGSFMENIEEQEAIGGSRLSKITEVDKNSLLRYDFEMSLTAKEANTNASK